MIPYLISDANLATTIQNGQLQQTHLDFRIEGGKIQVSENVKFRKEMEQNIYNHFNFMLRIAFYHGVFEEMTNFIGIYQKQFAQSTELYEYWKEIDQITDSVELQVVNAKLRLEQIEQYKEAPLQMEEFNEFKKQMSFAFLDKQFKIQAILQNLEEEKARVEFEADAITTKNEGELYLRWLKEQKPKQLQFKEDLDQITQQWSEQYQIYEQGRQFIENVDKNQVSIFTQKTWYEENWIQQLQDQIQNTIPFFDKLYKQYLTCLHYSLVLNELKDNVLINKEIKENLVETAVRIAEEPYIEKFLKYYSEKEEKALHFLATLQNIDQGKRNKECIKNINEQLFQIEKAYDGLGISVTKNQHSERNNVTNTIHFQINYVSDVTLHKKNLTLYYENPDNVEWDPRTLEQIEVVKQIQGVIKQLKAKLNRLDELQARYKELKQEPQRIALKYKQEFEQQIQQGEIKRLQFSKLLQQSELENYDSLKYSQQSMEPLLGALSEKMVIKRNVICMCCSRQPPHNADDIFFEDYQKVVAAEIRVMKNVQNKWFTSYEERVRQTNDLPVIKSSINFLLNPSILGALRNEDGQRQMKKGKREFSPYATIAKTIQQLCELAIVDQKLKLNLSSATVNQKILHWTRTLTNAKSGMLATNYSIPINGPE